MEIVVETRFAAAPERVLALCLRPATLVFVAAPLLRLVPEEASFPETWEDGARCAVRLRLFGVVPLGRQVIAIRRERPADGPDILRDNGYGTLVRRWDHRIVLRQDGGGTRYTDRVMLEAGLLTPFAAGFAQVFYRHRQRRLRRLLAET